MERTACKASQMIVVAVADAVSDRRDVPPFWKTGDFDIISVDFSGQHQTIAHHSGCDCIADLHLER
jgi:hypothetical protein